MCMEDYRLGKKISFIERQISLPAGGQVRTLVEQNENRVGLIIQAENVGSSIFISTTSTPILPTTNKYRLDTTRPIEWFLSSHGLLVQTKISGAQDGAVALTITVIELIYQGEERI